MNILTILIQAQDFMRQVYMQVMLWKTIGYLIGNSTKLQSPYGDSEETGKSPLETLKTEKGSCL